MFRKLVFVFIITILSISFIGCSNQKESSTDNKETEQAVTSSGNQINSENQQDKQTDTVSNDPKTGDTYAGSQAKAENTTVHIKHLTVEDTGKTLDIPYISNSERDIAILDLATSIQLVLIPGSIEYLICFDNTIYITDWNNSVLKKFLKDEVDGYRKDTVMNMHFRQDAGPPVWGNNPEVNSHGSYVLFDTNRCMSTGDYNMQTWVKNMETGDEWLVLPNGKLNVLGWIDDKTAVVSGPGIFSLNIDTLKKKVLINSDVLEIGLVKDYLIYQQKPGSITLRSIINGSESTFTSTMLNQANYFKGRGPWVAMLNQSSERPGSWTIVLYNIDTNIWKSIELSDDIWMNGYLWQDDSTLLIQTCIKGTQDASAYLINVAKLP